MIPHLYVVIDVNSAADMFSAAICECTNIDVPEIVSPVHVYESLKRLDYWTRTLLQ